MVNEKQLSAPVGDNANVVWFARLNSAVSGRMPVLDGWRALAILAVILHNIGLSAHRVIEGLAANLVDLAANMGWIGVQLFFVLSGFLITGILLDGRGAPRQLRNFYMRRVLRIFPVYYAVLIFFMVLRHWHITPEHPEPTWWNYIWYWTYLINWMEPFGGDQLGLSHFWSLAVEEQFYLLWPLLAVRLSERSLMGACIGLIVSAVAIRFCIVASYEIEFAKDAAYTFTCVRWDALAAGAVIALCARNAEWAGRLRRAIPWIAVSAFLYMLAIIAKHHNFVPVAQGVGALNQTAATAVCAAFLFWSVAPVQRWQAFMQQFLEQAMLRGIGKYSYAIYIFHLPISGLWFAVFGVSAEGAHRWSLIGIMLFNTAGVFVLSFALAVISWHLLEYPFLRLKHRFTDPDKASNLRQIAGAASKASVNT